MIDADPVATAVRAIMAERTQWTGTASELLGALGEVVGEAQRKAKTWPDSPRALSGRLRRAATFLRKLGIQVAFERERRTRARTVRITSTSPAARSEYEGEFASAPSAASAPVEKPTFQNGLASSEARTVGDDADANLPSAEYPSGEGRLV